jgi:hypothetical protein
VSTSRSACVTPLHILPFTEPSYAALGSVKGSRGSSVLVGGCLSSEPHTPYVTLLPFTVTYVTLLPFTVTYVTLLPFTEPRLSEG